MHRLATHALLVALSLLPAAERCFEARLTGYVRSDFGPHSRTYDGTSIYADERIVAASWDLPLGHYVSIAGLRGLYRIADRGLLGAWRWVDVAVWSRAEAFALTGRREVCLYAPEEV